MRTMRKANLGPIAAGLLALHLGACTSWQPSTISPRQLIEGKRPPTVRIIRTDGTALVMNSPSIANDSILSECGQGEFACRMRTGTLSLDDVRAIEVRTFNVAWAAAISGVLDS